MRLIYAWNTVSKITMKWDSVLCTMITYINGLQWYIEINIIYAMCLQMSMGYLYLYNDFLIQYSLQYSNPLVYDKTYSVNCLHT